MAIHTFNAITYSNKLTNDLLTKHYFKEHLDNRLNALLVRIGGMLVAAVGILFLLLKYHS
jgi:hypothetical protein